MANASDIFMIARRGDHRTAAYLLREEFEEMRSSPQRVDLCEWIARCFYQLEQFGEAGNWYEAAGQLILAEPSVPLQIKALTALKPYESALECYEQVQDQDTITECSEMLHQLRKACASA